MTMTLNDKHDCELKITSDIVNLERVEQFTEKFTHLIDISDDKREDILIAVTELVNNAIIHGNKQDKSKHVSICCIASIHEVSVSVTDEGKGFDPSKVGNPLDPDNIERISGRGIFLLNKLMDSLDYSFSDKGTTITIIKHI